MGLTEVLQGAVAAKGVVGSEVPQLGHVRWLDDLDSALAISRTSGRPVFCFVKGSGYPVTVFNEQVLGCTELSRVIQENFEPVVVGGQEVEGTPAGSEASAESYESYGYGTSWHDPVVRFLSPEGADLIPKREGIHTTRAMATRMVAALQANGQTAPRSLMRLSRS